MEQLGFEYMIEPNDSVMVINEDNQFWGCVGKVEGKINGLWYVEFNLIDKMHGLFNDSDLIKYDENDPKIIEELRK